MDYPNFKNKYLEEALFHPKDFIKYIKEKRINLPKKWILIFQKSTERYIKRKFKLKRDKENHSGGNSYISGNVGFFRMGGIGSPHAVTVLEELIAMGGREFIIIGTAGGLQNQGIFLCNKAIRDEGTSHHYVKLGKYSYPDKNLTKKFERSIVRQGLNPVKGTTWTIDAPYRETKKEIARYKKEGVKTVEMEASALFVVAKVRNVKIAAAFAVSDIVGGDSWDPQFDRKHVKIKLNRLIDSAVECLK